MQNRSVSPVISVILMVAIVVVLAAVLSAFVLDSTESLDDPAPNVADTTGEFEPETDGFRTNQIVRVTHQAGDSVPVEEIELVVRASGPSLDAESRLVNLPAEDDDFDPENFENGNPSNLINDGGFLSRNKIIIADGDSMWSAGDTIQFRINSGPADFTDGGNADTIEAIIVHTSSNSILSEHTFTP
jgi:flagellin-like protein